MLMVLVQRWIRQRDGMGGGGIGTHVGVVESWIVCQTPKAVIMGESQSLVKKNEIVSW